MRWAADDLAAVKAFYEITQAVRRVDDPLGAPMSERVARALLTSPSEPAETWFVPGGTPGSAVAMYHLRLPDRENLRRASLFLGVHPDRWRRGIGTALLTHAARRATENGRTVLGTSVIQGTAGEAFARRLGASPGLADARRVQVLTSLNPSEIAALRESAARAAAGYSLVTWTGRIPDEYLDGVAGVFNAMSDAPREPGREPRVWDAQRVRENLDDQRDLFGSRGYFVAALHAETGEMAAVTQVEVDPEHPQWGTQQITAVARPHRGHRLGLLVKTAMIEWLAAAEPGLERIVTWNADVNDHMIAINKTLGYELLDPQSRSYELQVADVLALAG